LRGARAPRNPFDRSAERDTAFEEVPESGAVLFRDEGGKVPQILASLSQGNGHFLPIQQQDLGP
jgi:hypothetical protein